MPRKLTEIEAWEVVRKTFYKVNAYGGCYRCAETGRRHYGMCSIVEDLWENHRIPTAVGKRMLGKIRAALVYDALYLYELDEKGAAKRRSFCNARIKELENGNGNKARNRSARTTVDK